MRLAAVILTLGLLVLPGCCVCPKAAQALKDAVAVNEGHMNDAALPEEARAIAQDNYDFDVQALYYMGELEELPADTRERMEARAGGGGQ